MTPNSDLAFLQSWTPIRFFCDDHGQPTVEWSQLGDLRFNAPFFAQTIQTIRARNAPTCLTQAAVLTSFAETAAELPLSGLIFHLSRCGSTLVTQMLAALPAHVVLSEPEAVDGVFRAGGRRQPADAETRTGWLRGLARAWSTRRFPEERRVFLKLDPWEVLNLDAIRAAFPEVPCVFLYRDPVEILVSQSENFAGAMFSSDDGPARLGLAMDEVSEMSTVEYTARVVGLVAQTMADGAARDPLIRLIDYSQLPGAVETVIAPWFGLSLDDTDKQQMRQIAHFHAKAPGKLVFQEDSSRKQRDADGELRALSARWIDPAYARLEEIRLAQTPT